MPDTKSGTTVKPARRSGLLKRDHIRMFMSIVAGSFAAVTLGVAWGYLDDLRPPQGEVKRAVDEAVAKQTANLLDQIAVIDASFNRLEKALADVEPDTVVAVRLDEIRNQVGGLAQRLDQLESYVKDDVNRLIALPLLKSEITTLRGDQEVRYSALEGQVDQVYDQGKWLTGAIAVSVLGLAIANLIRKPQREEGGEGD